jgi:4-hydroxy-tetrahydrodipicolinate reductase
MTTRVAVVGATGKMGRLACRLVEESEGFELSATLSSRDPMHELLGADLVVDFTHPAVSPDVVAFAVDHGINVLVGTSGWSAERIGSLRHTIEGKPDVGVVIVPNFSVGSVLVTAFSALAARFYDSIEIVEAHHAGKVDSPSGTAVRTAELIGEARAAVGPVSAPHSDQRARGQQVASVPVHSLRMAGIVAKQDVIFGGQGEVVTLSHGTLSSASYEKVILLGLSAAATARGVTVDLDSLIDLMPGEQQK